MLETIAWIILSLFCLGLILAVFLMIDLGLSWLNFRRHNKTLDDEVE